ncbi:glycosyltransferase family 4 protein [uncultured Parabacteroides sp.]|uniref:glycosyltransferase family 4 protein n=1 Tax=uncultured Parabacteroides sp. TaxID=512312 RepID=UPI00261EEE66|nr:glycosyltransferase family 4 protein [uncultured Parabacteroides sp.]
MNILIVVPSFKILGGVANHYMGLHPHWKKHISYCVYGKRLHVPAVLCLIPDYLMFVIKLLFCKVDLVIVNPSLRSYQLKRDAVYLRTAKFFGKKVVTFIHGWDYAVAAQFEKNPIWFQRNYGNSQFIYVLCSDFKQSLEKMKLNIPVILTSTKVSDSLIDNFDIKVREGKIYQILFLARIEKSKGIFITLDTFALLKKQIPNLKLSVCGSGSALEEAKQYVVEHGINDVVFYGNISGEQIKKQFKESDLYILPTHGEGMATSVLEAMAFGLPIVSRPVGGVKDFFVNEKMGILTESFLPEDYAEIIGRMIDNPQKVKAISETNHKYAIKHFLASAVAKKYEKDIERYYN